MHCPYGQQISVDDQLCNKCKCLDPCENINCEAESLCAIDVNINKTHDDDPNFIGVCRKSKL